MCLCLPLALLGLTLLLLKKRSPLLVLLLHLGVVHLVGGLALALVVVQLVWDGVAVVVDLRTLCERLGFGIGIGIGMEIWKRKSESRFALMKKPLPSFQPI